MHKYCTKHAAVLYLHKYFRGNSTLLHTTFKRHAICLKPLRYVIQAQMYVRFSRIAFSVPTSYSLTLV